MALKLPLDKLKLPSGKLLWISLAGVVVVLIGVPLLVVLLWPSGDPQNVLKNQFRDLINDISQADALTVKSAISQFTEEKQFRRLPTYYEEIVEGFAKREQLLSEEHEWEIGTLFWKTVMKSGAGTVESRVAENISRLRHVGVLLGARREAFSGIQEMPRFERSGLRKFLGEELLDALELPERDLNRILLWDRVQLEEMSGRTREAYRSFSLLEAHKVLGESSASGHWELDREKYLFARADLLGRLRNALAQLGAEETLVDFHDDGRIGDAETRNLIETEEARETVRAILWLNRRDEARVIKMLDAALADFPREVSGESFTVRFAYYVRALAHYNAARRAFEKIDFPSAYRSAGSQRTRLEMRLMRYYAELGLRDEYDRTFDEYFPQTRREWNLLDALRRMTWAVGGERDRARDRYADELRLDPSLIHDDDRDWSMRNMRREVPRVASPVQTLFRVGRIFDDLGDSDALKRTVNRIEFYIQGDDDQAYLDFLSSLLFVKDRMLIEAWQSLGSILERNQLPEQISRKFLINLLESVQKGVEWQRAGRFHLIRANEYFDSMHRWPEPRDPDLAVAAGVGLWLTRASGRTLAPHEKWRTATESLKLLGDVLDFIERLKRLSYFQERQWLVLRDGVIENFQQLIELGRAKRDLRALDEAGELLKMLGKLQHSTDETQFLPVKGALHRHMAQLEFESGGRQAARADWLKAGQDFEETAMKEDAMHAYEQAGDLVSLVRVAETVFDLDRDNQLKLGKAQLQLGDYSGAMGTFDDLIKKLFVGDVARENINTAVLEANYPVHTHEDLNAFLALDDYMESANGLGEGYLIYNVDRQSLKWRAPTDRNPGPEMIIRPREIIRLESGDDSRKTIVVTVKGSTEKFPRSNRVWPIRVLRREAPLDPAEAYVNRARAKIYLARLRHVADKNDAIGYLRESFRADADPEVVRSIRHILEEILTAAYRDEARRDEIAIRLRELARERQEGLRVEVRDSAERSRQNVLRASIQEIESQIATLNTVDGAMSMVHSRDQWLQELSRGYYLFLLARWLDEAGEAGVRTIDMIERQRLDREARRDLIFLCENFGNRHPIWKGAMYLRAFQFYRLARETEVAKKLAFRETEDRSVRVTRFEENARELLTRLALTPGTLASPEWGPSTSYLLGRLWSKAGQWDRSHHWFDQLTRWDLAIHQRDLLEEERQGVLRLIQSAFLSRADASFDAGNHARALKEYKDYLESGQDALDSPIVLWIHYQIGNCYVELGRVSEGLQEFIRGKGILNESFLAPEAWEHWLTGGHTGALAGLLEASQGKGSGKKDVVQAGATATTRKDWPSTWRQLFDSRIRDLSGRQGISS